MEEACHHSQESETMQCALVIRTERNAVLMGLRDQVLEVLLMYWRTDNQYCELVIQECTVVAVVPILGVSQGDQVLYSSMEYRLLESAIQQHTAAAAGL